MGTAANYKVLYNHISAQLLLTKHRHSKKPTGAKSQPVTSQGYLQSKDIDRILSIYSFRDLPAGVKFKNDTNLSCQNNRGKVGKTMKFVHLWQRKGNEIRANLPKSDKSLANRHEAKLPIQISHL